jgi:hypothetical protein
MKMGQNSFENQIKEKLENRSITPSNEVWNRLNEMLPVPEEPKRNFKWMMLVASCIGFISIAIFFQRQPDELFDADKPKIAIENKMAPGTEITINSSNGLGVILDKKNSEKETDKVESKLKQKNNHEVLLLEQNVVENNLKSNLDAGILNENQKPIVINQETQNSSELGTNESNSLKETSQKNDLDAKSNQIRVNANSLLSQVENELNLTFRQKVVMKIAKNYKATKEVLVARNQQ